MAVPTFTANSPSAGYIAWTAFHIQYNGVAYAVNAGNSNDLYIYWLYNGGSPSTTLSTSNTQPTLTADDIIIAMNKNGVPISIQNAQLVDGDMIVNGTVTASNIAVGTLTGNLLEAGTITSDLIGAGQIVANNIAAGTITGYQLEATAIDGFDINGVTITGSTIESTSGGVFVYQPGGTTINANPNFTSGITDWTATYGSISYTTPTYTPSGGSAHDTMQIAVSTSFAGAYRGSASSESETITAGDAYFVSFIVQSSGLVGQAVLMAVDWYNGSTNVSNTTVAEVSGNISGWTQYTAVVTAPSGATSMQLQITGLSNNSTGGTVNVAQAAITTEPMLTESMAPAAGTDQYGNSYSAGIIAYGSGQIGSLATGGTSAVALTAGMNGPGLYAVPSNTLAHATMSPSVWTSVNNSGASNEYMWLVSSSGKNGQDDAAIQMRSESFDATVPAELIFEFGGQATTYITKAAGINANQPGTSATPETWHAMTLSNSWTVGSGGIARYKLLPNNMVMVQLNNVSGGTISDGTVLWTAPTGYVPTTEQKLPLVATYSSAPTFGSMPFLYTNGAALEVFDLRGTISGIHTTVIYALD